MKITAVRHGETEGNVRQVTQSHAPGKLTRDGIQQAKKLALLLEDEVFDIAYSSDLKRASDTASIILERHTNTGLICTPLLRERSLGVLDGMPYGAVPSEVYDVTNIDFQPTEGESLGDVRRRLILCLNDLYKQHPRAHVLVVSHGWTLKIMRSLLTDLSLEESWNSNIGNATAQMWLMTEVLDAEAS
jgi:probable phosphoglycerate mutase